MPCMAIIKKCILNQKQKLANLRIKIECEIDAPDRSLRRMAAAFGNQAARRRREIKNSV